MKAPTFSPGRAWERLRSVPGLGRDVIAIAALIVVAVVATGVMLSRTQFVPPWAERTLIWAEFQEAPAVNPESTHKVTMAGVEVGKIVDWRPTDHGTAELQLRIEPGHQVYDNAHAVLRSVNPLNEMYVEINPGGPPGSPLPEDGVIPVGQTERPVQPDEVLAHLDDRTQIALTSLLTESDAALARAPQELPEGLRATSDTLGGVRPVVEALQQRRQQLAELTTALGQISNAVGGNDERLARLADATQQTLATLAGNDGDLRASLEQLPGLNDELRHALSSTQQLTDQLDPTLDNLHRAADDLPEALDRLTGTVGEFGFTVKAARPVVEQARPFVADLRPFVEQVDRALDDALPVTDRLDGDTAIVTSYLSDVSAFVYNTSSVFSLQDEQGGFIRGHVIVVLPDGNALPGGGGGYPLDETTGGSPDDPGPLGGMLPGTEEGGR
ncbi:MlaD family protein [Pseudonocardia sp. RS010]|uniref:MlaD family protein n=1 Tax=Pseudonocardia sp. RS010 TaxID=3385979 RepID=UPI0039A09886